MRANTDFFYLSSLFGEKFVPTVKSIKFEKDPVDQKVNENDIAFREMLGKCVKNNVSLAKFIEQNEDVLQGKELNDKLYHQLPTQADKKIYRAFIEAKEQQLKLEKQLAYYQEEENAAQPYKNNLATLKTLLQQENSVDTELLPLKNAAQQLLQYIDKNKTKYDSIAQLNKIILALTELLEPTNLEDTRTETLRHQELVPLWMAWIVPHYATKSYQCSKRYFDFAMHIDKVKGARRVNTEKYQSFIWSYLFSLCCIPIGIIGVTMNFNPLNLALLITGIVFLLLAFVLHLSMYPRTRLSKQLKIVADTAVKTEESRLCLATIAEKSRLLVEQYPQNTHLSSAIQYIKDTYVKTNPQKALRLLNGFDNLLKTEDENTFSVECNHLQQDLGVPKKNGFFFRQAKVQISELPKPIAEFISDLTLVQEQKKQEKINACNDLLQKNKK